MNQFLSFTIGAEEYGLEILDAREIIPYGEVTRVPALPRSVRGLLQLRGAAVPVVDLAVVFGQPERPVTKRTCVVVVANHTGRSIGLVVDGIHQVLALRPDEIDPPFTLGASRRTSCLRGTARTSDRFVLLLDLAAVLAQLELEPLTEQEAAP